MYQDFTLESSLMLTVSSIGLGLNLLMMFVMSDGVAHCIQIIMDLCCFNRKKGDNFEKLPSNPAQNSASNDHKSHSHHGHSHSSHGHSHASHGHSHMNMNVRAAILHIVGDILQSLGVLLAAIIVHFWPHLKIADPICTLFFAGIVFLTTKRIFLDTIHILMEGFPADLDYENIKNILSKSIDSVRHVHSLHVWSLTHGRNVLTAHLAIDKNHSENFNTIRSKVQHIIRKEFGIEQSTIQIEYFEQNIVQQCQTCLELQ